jgi:hypothetical protein
MVFAAGVTNAAVFDKEAGRDKVEPISKLAACCAPHG